MASTWRTAAVMILVVGLLWLAGCVTLPTPQAEISVILSPEGMLPATWRVPAGQQITIHFNNHTSVSCDWKILVGDNALDPQAAQKPAEYWNHLLPAGADETVVFKAPAAAANYHILCTPSLSTANELTGRLIVVQPLNSNP